MSKIVTVKTGPNSYAQGELVGGSLVGDVGELVKWCHKLSRMAFAYGDIEASERYASAADALEAQAAEIERLREALEEKGTADVYRDGFDAAIDTAKSVKMLPIFGNKITPNDAMNYGADAVVRALISARAALTEGQGDILSALDMEKDDD